MKTTLRILAGLFALILFLPVLIIALLHDAVHLVVAFLLYVFANLCYFAADKGKVTYMDCLQQMNIKE
jgi:hypothetical protein